MHSQMKFFHIPRLLEKVRIYNSQKIVISLKDFK